MHSFGVSDHMLLAAKPRRKSLLTLGDFYKLGHKGPTRLSVLVPCAADDPELSIVSTDGTTPQYHRPWDLVWACPAPWTEALVGMTRLRQEMRVHDGIGARALPSALTRPALFEQFPPLTLHERVRVHAWVAECQAKAAAWTAPA